MKLHLDTIRNIVYHGAAYVESKKQDSPNIVVFCYHSISEDGWRYSVSPRAFEEQMNHLMTWGKSITLDDLTDYLNGKIKITNNSFLITFDDGYSDVLLAKPILSKFRIKPTLFVLSNPSNANRQVLDTQRRLLNDRELKSISHDWDIGCHSATHAVLTQCTTKQLDHEIIESKKLLEEKIDRSVGSFCYPKGQYNSQISDMVKAAGYDVAFSMNDQILTSDNDHYCIPRVGVDGSHTMKEFSVLYKPSVTAIRGIAKKFAGGIYA